MPDSNHLPASIRLTPSTRQPGVDEERVAAVAQAFAIGKIHCQRAQDAETQLNACIGDPRRRHHGFAHVQKGAGGGAVPTGID